MIASFLRIIGISDTFSNRIENVQWLWARPALLWVGLVLLVPLAAFIVLRHKQSLPHVAPVSRSVLTACRVGALLLLIIVLAGPYVRVEEHVTHKPLLAMIIDESASMTLPAGPFDSQHILHMAAATKLIEASPEDGEAPRVDPEIRHKLNRMSRLALIHQTLTQREHDWIAPLRDRFDLSWYHVARRVRMVRPDVAASEPLSPAEADGTALGQALRRAFDDAAGNQLSGILIFSDGRWTSGPDPHRIIAARGSVSPNHTPPIWSVPVGTPEPITDIALLDVLVPNEATQDDTVTIIATISSHGFDGRDVEVKLMKDQTVLVKAAIKLRDGQRQQVNLSHLVEKPGATLLTVVVDPQPQEVVQQNNRQTCLIQVHADRLNVLYLEGTPRWDFRFLDHALRRDRGINPTLVMESQLLLEGAQLEPLPKRARLPQDAAGFAEFHAVILGDISPSLLPQRWQEQLALAVEEDGLGLIVQAGPTHMPHAYVGQPLGRLLPVKIDNGPEEDIEWAPGITAPAFAPFQMKITSAGAIHPAFQLYTSATKNRSVWSQMPPFYWVAAASKTRAGTTILAEFESLGQKRPLIAEQFAGRGRVLFIGADSTYRWRRNIGSHLFYRFWGQAIRHVAVDRQRSGDGSWIQAHPTRIEPGEHIGIELYALDKHYEPLNRASVTIQVTGADARDVVILKRAGQAGHFRGTWQAPRAGEYRFTHTDGSGQTIHTVARAAGSGRELLRPGVDRDALGSLADATGGELLELNEFGQLLTKLKGEPLTTTRSQEEEIWDNWLTLVLLVGIYCTDVGVRRLLGLT